MRERLTELGLDFVARQVAADADERVELEEVSGQREIPVLVFETGESVVGDDDILAALEHRYSDPPGAREHRQRAAEHA